MVPVRGDQVERAEWVLCEDDLRLPPADLPRDVTAKGSRGLELAVGVAEEDHALYAEHLAGPALLLFSDLRQAFGGHSAIARSLVPVGHDEITDLAPLLDPLGYCSTAPELGIIGVRHHHHHFLNSFCHVSSFHMRAAVHANRSVFQGITAQAGHAVDIESRPAPRQRVDPSLQ